MKKIVPFFAAFFISLAVFCQSGPELVFTNPVLVSGTALKQGAVYRFSNVTTGVDATVKLKKFSRNDIVMPTVDNSVLGWNKALQPEFGLPGVVAPFQNWYVDFEMTFYKAGTNSKQKMDTIDFTALDVDGDGNSINEYVTFDRPHSITYSTLSYLTSNPVGLIGQLAQCGEDEISSVLIACSNCGGTGLNGTDIDNNCGGSGLLHSECQHAYEAGTGNIVNGPVSNFPSIDTSATQVMAVYRYLNRDNIKFRYGARSGALSSNGSGIRLNSIWFREFSLAPFSTLPVNLTAFSASLNNNKVDLTWSTASEINVSHFVVEKSTDGINYKDAGVVFAYGTATGKADYKLSDNISNDQAKIIYYRLRSVDIDGKGQLSATRIIRRNSQEENKITILTYPNPVSNELRITVPANWQNKKAVYEVFNSNGQIAKRTETSNSSQTETINVTNLAPGFYIVRVSCEGQIAQQKIVKH